MDHLSIIKRQASSSNLLSTKDSVPIHAAYYIESFLRRWKHSEQDIPKWLKPTRMSSILSFLEEFRNTATSENCCFVFQMT